MIRRFGNVDELVEDLIYLGLRLTGMEESHAGKINGVR